MVQHGANGAALPLLLKPKVIGVGTVASRIGSADMKVSIQMAAEVWLLF